MREYTDQEIRSEIHAMWQGIGQQKQHRNGRTEWRASNEEPASSLIKIIPFDQIKLNEDHRSYLVEGLIPNEGLTIVWGPPKSGKSFAKAASTSARKATKKTAAKADAKSAGKLGYTPDRN